ncbi:MAG: hypothetical protein BMS9Abin36_0068 [Gammaproteobacteria bacterium]|nr:MAG: hypothetical protein BMS9Abin36_0068 [Gammaproteobacteria bacterium]
MSDMSDRDFTRSFTYMLVAMAALTVVIYVIANSIGGKPEKTAAVDKDVVARIAPVGQVSIMGSVLNAVIPAAQAADGKATFNASCAACHATGVAGAPKVGDKANWKARIAQGNKTLYSHAIKGYQGKKGFMPAKGGNASLSDAAVKAAVDHMVAGSK